jgi:hypothetical protein
LEEDHDADDEYLEVDFSDAAIERRHNSRLPRANVAVSMDIDDEDPQSAGLRGYR